jgi:hypothetical protein
VQLFFDRALEAGFCVVPLLKMEMYGLHEISEGPVSATEGRRSREVSAKVSASTESGSTDMHLPVDPHLDLVLLLARSLGAKLVWRRAENQIQRTRLWSLMSKSLYFFRHLDVRT